MPLDPVDVSDLIARPGSSRRELLRGSVGELSTPVAAVDGEVEAELLLEGLVEGVFVSGRVRGAFALRCARCLDAFGRAFSIEMTELVGRTAAVNGDGYVLGADRTLDPQPLVVDAIGLEMPFSPLCRPDCLGLCEVCGENRNHGGCPGHPTVDPRWAGLEAVLERLGD